MTTSFAFHNHGPRRLRLCLSKPSNLALLLGKLPKWIRGLTRYRYSQPYLALPCLALSPALFWGNKLQKNIRLHHSYLTQDKMSDSDGEYVADASDDDIGAHQVSAHGTRSAGPAAAGSSTRSGDTNAGTSRRKAAWEDIQRSWDTVVEGADGSINSAVQGLKDQAKKKRQVSSIYQGLAETDMGALQIVTRYHAFAERYYPASYACTRPFLCYGGERFATNKIPIDYKIRMRFRHRILRAESHFTTGNNRHAGWLGCTNQ